MAATSRQSTSGASRDRVRMASRLPVVVAPRNGNDEPSPLIRAATIWGCSPRVARERMDRAFVDAADVVAVLMQAGQHDRLAQKMAPLDAALNAWAGAPAMMAAVLAEAESDAEEDTTAARYHVEPNRINARAWVRTLARGCFHAERLMARLRLEWEL